MKVSLSLSLSLPLLSFYNALCNVKFCKQVEKFWNLRKVYCRRYLICEKLYKVQLRSLKAIRGEEFHSLSLSLFLLFFCFFTLFFYFSSFKRVFWVILIKRNVLYRKCDCFTWKKVNFFGLFVTNVQAKISLWQLTPGHYPRWKIGFSVQFFSNFVLFISQNFSMKLNTNLLVILQSPQ